MRVCLSLNSSLQVIVTALDLQYLLLGNLPVFTVTCPGTLPYIPSPTPKAEENPGDKDMGHKPYSTHYILYNSL